MCIRDREWPALIFAYLRPEQTTLGLIREDDDDDILPRAWEISFRPLEYDWLDFCSNQQTLKQV